MPSPSRHLVDPQLFSVPEMLPKLELTVDLLPEVRNMRARLPAG
jgi:hypothetical protein